MLRAVELTVMKAKVAWLGAVLLPWVSVVPELLT